MMMNDQIAKFPEWNTRTHVEAWLSCLAREAGEYAGSAMADFGARIDENGDVDVSHLSDDKVAAIMDAAKSA